MVKVVPVIVGELPVVSERRLLEIKELLTPEEAGAILRCKDDKVRYMCRMGKLSGVKVHGSLRIKSASILAMLDGDN